ncbi:MAG: methylenetetrahydrofolate reductase [Dehalococcoidia bacterium]|nr:methylenetetrahydrofolate reductase [Dehalococcoidia bacterium]
MKIGDLLKNGYSLSFEFFPAKDEMGEKSLFATIDNLQKYNPAFVSVTYGAGGSTSKNTRHVIEHILGNTSIIPMPHLTCINQSRQEMEFLLADYQSMGADNIMALRGDPPLDSNGNPLMAKSSHYARELVEWISEFGGYSVGVAVYPEGHIDMPNLTEDMLFTKQKIEAGADFGISQMFFDNRFFYAFMERAQQVGIKVPIIAAIMPIYNIVNITNFCKRCGTTMPDSVIRRFSRGVSREDALETCVEFACEQIDDLMRNGVRHFHFYTLNRDEATSRIITNLGLQSLS